MNVEMLRKHATSFVLVAAALGLGLYVWLVDWDAPSTAELEARAGRLLPVMKRDEIQKIDFDLDGRKTSLVARKQGDAGERRFYFVPDGTPDQDAPLADEASVRELVRALDHARRLRKVEGDFDRKGAGLEPPQLRVTVHLPSASYRLAVGNEAKMPPGSRYVELAGEGVFVIGKEPARALSRPVAAYRSRRVIPYTASKLASWQIQRAQGTIQLDRGSWGGFRVDNLPAKPRVSAPMYNRLLQALADATAARFVPAKPAQEAQDRAGDKIGLVFVPKQGPRSEVTIGGACPGNEGPGNEGPGAPYPNLVVLSRNEPSPLHACVPSSVLADLSVPAAALADRRAFATSADQVEAMEIERGGDVLELIRKGSGWHVRKPEDREIPTSDVAGFLDALLAIEGTIVADPDLAGLGFEPPRGKVTVKSPELAKEKLPPQVVQIGGPTESDAGPALALRRKQDGVVLIVPAAADRLLRASTTLIRSTKLVDVSAQRVRRVEVTGPDGLHQIVARDGAGFDMVEPSGYGVDGSLAVHLFESVGRMKAERWVADHDDGSFGLHEPALELRFEVAGRGDDEGETRTMLLGGPTVEGRYATWINEAGVFEVSRTLVQTLRTWVLDRSGFMVDPNEVQSLTMRAGDRSLRIQASGETWQSAAGSGLQLPPESLSRIRRHLIDMSAEGTVHLGPPKPDEGMDEPALRMTLTRRPEMQPRTVEMTIGRADVWRNMNVYYARRKGTNATFAIAKSKVRPILDVLAAP